MRCQSWRIPSLFAVLILALPLAQSQTATYHLHKEASTINTSFDQLKTTGPDASAIALKTALTNQPAGDYVIKQFETQTSIPNAPGVIPGGSTMSFSLFMRKTSSPSGVTVKPEAKLRLNSATGTSLCSVIGAAALTTTVTKITFTCTTPTGPGITMSASDRFYLWVGVNISNKSSSTYSGELDIEGTLNGNFDSTITVKVPSAGLTPTSLSFANQIVNTTSAAQAVTLKNNQTTTLTISGITTSGDYAQTNNCGTSLAAGASCTINVTFKPTATGTRTGTLTVTDSGNDSPQTASLSGTGIALTSISVTPANPSVPNGLQQQFTATGTYSDNSQQNLTSTVTWSSSATSIATINSAGLASTVAQGTSTITATSGSINGSTTLTVIAPALVSIAVTPANPSVALGFTQQFTATGTYSDNSQQNLTSTVTWSSSPSTIATINSSGLASTSAQGTTTIKATSGAISGSTTLTVTAPALVSIAVTPANPSVALGFTQQFTATGTYSDNSQQNLTSTVTWSSSLSTIATINSSGLASTSAQGTTTIKATSGAISGSTTLTVTAPVLQSIAVTPANPSVALGLTQQFTATGTYSDNSQQNLTSTVTWSSSLSTIATINSSGLASTSAQGTTTIKATSGAISGSTTLTVTAPVLQSIAVTPANPSVALGLTQQFTATGTYSDNSQQNLTSTVTWSSSLSTIATINSSGLASTVAQGTTTITATSGTISGSTTLTVTAPVLQSIAVTPANPSVALGLTQQFTATGTYSDNSQQNLTSTVTWSSSPSTVATINSSGLASTSAQGTTTIKATSGAISGSTTLTVTAPVLQSIAVTPANPSVALGLTQQFTATGTYSDNSQQNLTSTVTWSSSLSTIATINSSGLASTVAQGTTTITATSGTISGSTTLTVTAPVLQSIAVTPANPSVALGLTQQFTATGTYSDNSQQNLTSTVTWNSSQSTIATISISGLATTVAQGTTTIGATYGTISGSTTLTVTAPALVSIAVTPANPSVPNGLQQQFTATGTYKDHSTQNLTGSASWNSSATAVATISNSGLATTLSLGTSTITATSGSINGQSTLTVVSSTGGR